MASRSILFAAIVVLALSACAQAKNPVFDEDMQEGWFLSPSEAEEAVAPTPPAPAADVVKHTESYKFILTEFSNILDIIQEETDFDNALVAAKQKLVEEAEAAEKAAEAAYNLAVKEFQDAKAAYEKAEAEYNQAVATYIKNKAVRDAERDLSSSIQGHVASLAAVGSEEATADLQVSTADITIENLEVAHQATAQSLHTLMSMVKRSSVHADTMSTQLKAIDTRLEAEENTEKAHVASKKDARDQAKVVMEAKQAAMNAAKENWDNAKELLVAAQNVLRETIAMRDENERKRNIERGIIEQATGIINTFITTGSVELDIQLGRNNQHTSAIEKVLAGIKEKVDEEERNQAAEVAAALAAKNAAKAALDAAIAHYQKMTEIVAEATAELARKQSAYDIAHKTIAVERATANQERRAISTMFSTLVRLSNRRVSDAGACPVDGNGNVCSANGLCTDGRSRCACNYGATGDDCGTCIEGYSKSSGVCQKSLTADIQVDAKDVSSVAAKYGLVDLSVDNLNLPYEKVHAAIQKIMTDLEAQEEKLEAELATAAAELAAAQAALDVALDNQRKALEAQKAAQAVYDEKSAIYKAIHEQYVRDKALREQQLSVISQVSTILAKLTAGQ